MQHSVCVQVHTEMWPFARNTAKLFANSDGHTSVNSRGELAIRGFHIGDAATKNWRPRQKFVIGLDR